MSDFLACSGLVAAVALLTVLAGRAWGAAVGCRWLTGRAPEAYAAAAVLGTALWALAVGWGCYLGLPAGPAVLAAGGATVALAVIGTRHSGTRWLRLPRAAPPALAFGAAAAAAAGLALLPLAVGGGYDVLNDTIDYLAMSETLQSRGFPPWTDFDPRFPTAYTLRGYQTHGYRMGSTFFLAAVQAASGRSAVDVFPAVTAWGVALNVAAVFLVTRWCLRLPRPFAAAGAVLAAAWSQSVYYSALHGFQPQLYGTALLATAAALLGRALAAASYRTGEAMTVGLAAAGLASCYSELLPVLVVTLAAAAAAAAGGRRAALFGVVAAVSAAALGNVEWGRAARALVLQAGVVVGWHVPFTPGHYAAFALGAHPVTQAFSEPHLIRVAAVMATLAAAGLFRLGRRPAVPLAAALVALLMLAAYFARKPDPWTHTPGHTWSLYKLCKWSTPLLAAVQAGGLYLALHKLPYRAAPLAAVCLLAAAAAWPAHQTPPRLAAAACAKLAESDRPLKAWRRLRQDLERQAPPAAYFVHRGARSLIDALPPRILPRVPFANDWAGTLYDTGPAAQPARPLAPGTLAFLKGRPPFEAGAGPLPGGFTRLPDDRPVVAVVRPRPDGRPVTELRVWVPRAGRVRLDVTPCRVAVGRVTVCRPDGPPLPTGQATGTRLTVEADLPAGVAVFHLAAGGAVGLDDARAAYVKGP